MRRTCAYCKACLMNFEDPYSIHWKDNNYTQTGCKLGYKLEKGPVYVHAGSTRDSFINDNYPVENCPKPKTITQFLKECKKHGVNMYGEQND